MLNADRASAAGLLTSFTCRMSLVNCKMKSRWWTCHGECSVERDPMSEACGQRKLKTLGPKSCVGNAARDRDQRYILCRVSTGVRSTRQDANALQPQRQ